MENTDRLMTALGKGDIHAFDALYESMAKAVYFTVLGLVKDRGLAEDVMQNTFVTVLEHAVDYRPGTNARAWILRIAKNAAINAYHRRRREQSVDTNESEYLFGGTQDDTSGALIELAQKLLPPDQFEILVMCACIGYKRREVAEILEIPIGTVTWKYNNACKTMKKALKGGDAI